MKISLKPLLAALVTALPLAAQAATFDVVTLSGVGGSDPRGPGLADDITFYDGGGRYIAEDGSVGIYNFLIFPDGSFEEVTYEHRGGVNIPLARTSDVIAGLPSDDRASSASLHTFSSYGSTFAYNGLTGGDVDGTNDAIYFAKTSTGATTSVRKGDPAPGFASNISLADMFGDRSGIGPAGQTYSVFDIAGPGINNSNRQVIFAGGFDSLVPVARRGDPNFGPGGGRTFQSLDIFRTFGTSLGVVSSGTDTADVSGAYLFRPNQAPLTLLEDGQSVGGGVVAGIFTRMANSSAEVISTTDWSDGIVDSLVHILSSPGGSRVIARGGTDGVAGPNRGPGVFFNDMSSAGSALVNSAGGVAFDATLAGSNVKGVYYNTGTTNQLVVEVGASSPYAGLTIADTQNFASNANGWIILESILAGPGVSDSNDFALLAWNASQGLLPLLREGDSLDVDPSAAVDERAINSILTGFIGGTDPGGTEYNGTLRFTDSGKLLLNVGFTDGSSAAIVFSVPEPASFTVLALGLVFMPLCVSRKR